MTEDIKMICHNCVGESFLKAEIQKMGRNHQCSYCKRRRRCYSLEQIGERIEGAFERHYVRTAQEPDSYEEARMRDIESDYEWFRHGEPVVEAIMDAADISEEAAQDIQQFLEDKHTTRSSWELSEEREFGESSHYEYKDVNSQHWQTEWNDFERSLKTENVNKKLDSRSYSIAARKDNSHYRCKQHRGVIFIRFYTMWPVFMILPSPHFCCNSA